MKQPGLGPDEMTELHPRLIYLSLPGFASTDREEVSIRAFEGVVKEKFHNAYLPANVKQSKPL